ncbi:MAG: single-stranded DNA-binding protein [Lewinellaceae bacterium]|nr:single-stranded DNA-binding protein [Lewinellaceae bacterium]
MVNKVTLIGRLGGDPEMRHLENGVAVARFSLATNEYYKDKDGNPQETTEWHNIVIWREGAERAEKQLKKGGMVYVEGKITYRKYTGQDGAERNVTDIVASTFRSLERREGSGESRFPSAEPAFMAGKSNTPGAESTPAPAVTGGDDAGAGDDLPF